MYTSHPWYSQTKRKRSVEDLNLNPKRPRSSLISHFAQMSLTKQPPPLVDVEMSQPSDDQQQQQLRDIKMKVSNWYESEPDRIVITSLDSSSDEEEEEEEQPVVSPAVLQRLRSPLLPPAQVKTPSQALVLYKPVVPKNKPNAMDVE